MLPASQTRKVENASSATFTDKSGDIQSSGGKNLRRTDPTRQPTTPLGEVANQLSKGPGNLNARA